MPNRVYKTSRGKYGWRFPPRIQVPLYAAVNLWKRTAVTITGFLLIFWTVLMILSVVCDLLLSSTTVSYVDLNAEPESFQKIHGKKFETPKSMFFQIQLMITFGPWKYAGVLRCVDSRLRFSLVQHNSLTRRFRFWARELPENSW